MSFILNNKPNLVVFANCHGEKYLDILKRDTNVKDLFNIEYFVSYQELDNFDNLKSKFENADILIINRIKSYTDFTINNLKKILKKNCVLIVIPFIRFNGYWLEEEKFKNLKYFKRNSVEDFSDIELKDIDSYLKEKINYKLFLNHYNNSLKKLKEIDNFSDIKFYDFFIKNHLKYPLFRDYKHPTANFIEYIGHGIITLICNKFDLKYVKKELILKNDIYEYGHFKPIQNNVKEYLNIEYDLDKIFICSRYEYFNKILNYESNNNNDNIIDLDDMLKLFK